MHETTTAYVGLDVHKDAIAVAVAETGRAPARFHHQVRQRPRPPRADRGRLDPPLPGAHQP
jgi:hypothetical protein